MLNTIDDSIINFMQNTTGVKYSDEQLKILRHRGGMCILASAGSGKALAHGTGVLTPSGYVAVEKLSIGSVVFDESGNRQSVIGIYPQGSLKVWEVKFSGGRVLRVSGDHLWNYKILENSPWMTGTTEEMSKILKSNKLRFIRIPVNKPINFGNDIVPESPYFAGKAYSFGYDVNGYKFDNSIIDTYKYSSISSRHSFITGIIDMSGTVIDNKYYKILFREDLYNYREDIIFILESLGYREIMVTRDGIIFPIYSDAKKFHTDEDIEKLIDISSLATKPDYDVIIDISETSEVCDMTCIKVSGESELFLTEDCIVTHNTTVLNHLIAKRIQTHEIGDPSKLLCTTFSKGGATEMGQRLDDLLKQLGIRSRVTVKTLHAVYLQLLKDLGYNLNIIETSAKMRFIREACKDAGVKLEDEEYQTLEGIFGFQINNLMSDADLFKSYAYTLRDQIPLDKYSYIRQAFSNKKQIEGCMDFDDMQLFVFTLLKSPEYGAAIQQYCHSLWQYIYVDEAQDVSKIQFEILKMLISDPNKLVFIGDDDQCLTGDTIINTDSGFKCIKNIKVGDKVLSAVGHGKTDYCEVVHTSSKEFHGEIIEIETESGNIIKGTPDHIGFAIRDINNVLGGFSDTKNPNYVQFVLFDEESDNTNKSRSKLLCCAPDGYKGIVSSDLDLHRETLKKFDNYPDEIDIHKYARLGDYGFDVFEYIKLGDMRVGYGLPIFDEYRNFRVDLIKSIKKYAYNDLVYDISIPETVNFIANGVVVHNCIYQWRGADPSIILNICGIYTDLTLMTLTTNYRCKSEIVNPAAHGIEFNRVRSNKTMKPFKEGGKVSVCDIGNGNMFEMSKYAYKLIKELVIDKGVMPNNIAVLCRNNQHLTLLSNMLFRDGIYCKSSDDMKFTKGGMYKTVEGIVQMAQNTTNGTITAGNLHKCCAFMPRTIANQIGNIQTTYGLALSDILGFLLTKYSRRRDVEWDDPGIKVGALEHGKYTNLIARINYDSIESLVSIYKLLSSGDTTKAVCGMLNMFLTNKAGYIFRSEESSRFAEGYIEYLCSIVNEMGITNYMKFIRSVEQYEAGGMAIISPMVTLSTMHGAKGKEWEHVILFADDNVSFPSFQNINSNIEDGVPDRDIRCMIDENRRLHYVAMTRAKDRLYILGNKMNLGLYTLESLGIMDFGGDNNSHIIAMAQHGMYKDLVSKVQVELFGQQSNYFYGLSIDKIDTKAEEQYKELNSEKHKKSEETWVLEKNSDTSLNINNIQTYAPMVLGDDEDSGDYFD